MKVEIQRCRQFKPRENIFPPKLLYLSKYFFQWMVIMLNKVKSSAVKLDKYSSLIFKQEKSVFVSKPHQQHPVG